MRKTVFSGFVITAAFIVGFVFLIRSCLSAYDEYTLEGNARVFRQPSASILVYIKDHFDVSYYSQEGAVTNTGGNHYYYLETRDALSLNLLHSTRLDGKNSQLSQIIGNTGKILWVLDQQLKAFDPFTHAIVCNEAKLVQQNPALRGVLPTETQYYTFDYINNRLEIFTKNASRFSIGENFIATPIDENAGNELVVLNRLKAKLKDYEIRRYSESSTHSYQWHDSAQKIEKQIRVLEDENTGQKKFHERLNNMQRQRSLSIDELTINASVKDSTVYALIPRQEMDTTHTSLSVRQYFSAEEQRYLWSKELPFTDIKDLVYLPDKAVIFCSKPPAGSENKPCFLVTVIIQNGGYRMVDIKSSHPMDKQ